MLPRNSTPLTPAAVARFTQAAEGLLAHAGDALQAPWREVAMAACERIGEARKDWSRLFWVFHRTALAWYLHKEGFQPESAYILTLSEQVCTGGEEAQVCAGTTLAAYHKRSMGLLNDASEALGISWQTHPLAALDYIAERRAEVSRGSWRIYRSALRTFFEGEGELFLASYIQDMSSLPALRRGQQTSAFKRKAVSQEEHDALVEKLSDPTWKNRHDLLLWLLSGIYTGLRPREWRATHLEGRLLTVKNAKATHGRAFAEVRHLDLSDLPEKQFVVVEAFINDVLSQVTDIDKFYEKHSRTLRRICKELWPKRKRRITLYSGRHQFSANGKAAGASPQEIAAMMGHADVETHRRHYGKGKDGHLGGGRVKPLEEDVEKVMALNPDPVRPAPSELKPATPRAPTTKPTPEL